MVLSLAVMDDNAGVVTGRVLTSDEQLARAGDDRQVRGATRGGLSATAPGVITRSGDARLWRRDAPDEYPVMR
jgi:hypothetical protein